MARWEPPERKGDRKLVRPAPARKVSPTDVARGIHGITGSSLHPHIICITYFTARYHPC